ncbi:hypothetical protein C8R43DRAFT_674430 [Mycena crocata]|nr:hypothetical protein C8R43DRAFT_674430 [Mycena crocata]
MSNQPPSAEKLVPFTKRRRTYVACKACRKRKIKCISTGEDMPCKRCAERGFKCEFIPVAEERRRERAGRPGGESSTSTLVKAASSSLDGLSTSASQNTFEDALSFQPAPSSYTQPALPAPLLADPFASTSSAQHQLPKEYPYATAIYAIPAPQPEISAQQLPTQYDQYFSSLGVPPIHPEGCACPAELSCTCGRRR